MAYESEYSYDEIKRNTTIGSFQTSYEKDVLNRLEKIVYPSVSGKSLEVNYDFSNNGEVNSIRINKNNSGVSNLIEEVNYNSFGNISKVTRSNGTDDILSYYENDKSFRLKSIEVTKGQQRLLDYLYEYEKNSNLVQRSNPILSEVESFSYDSLDRLQVYNINSSLVKNYAFDEIGNITLKGGTSYSYSSQRNQILTSLGAVPVNFDIFGNIINDGVRDYIFNHDNRLSSITKSGVTTSYIYDHEGIRVEKQNPTDHVLFLDKYSEVKNGVPIYHIFLGDKRVASINSTNSLEHIHQDHLGSTSIRTDSLGAVSYSQTVLPFGEKRTEAGSLSDLFSLYTDQYFDSESDIYYYKQRYYSQGMGRFISADPLYISEMDTRGLEPDELNLFSYAGNSPVMFNDPLGGKAQPVDTGAVAAFYNPHSGNFIARSEVVDIKPRHFIAAVFAVPAVGALGSVGKVAGGVKGAISSAIGTYNIATSVVSAKVITSLPNSSLGTSVISNMDKIIKNTNDFFANAIEGASSTSPNNKYEWLGVGANQSFELMNVNFNTNNEANMETIKTNEKTN